MSRDAKHRAGAECATGFSWERFEELPVVGILRGFDEASTREIARAARRGGLRNIELTMNTDGAASLIEILRDETGGELNVGAGTVRSLGDLDRALDAGAQFIVTPIVLPDVIAACRDRGVPVFPGALTPTEIWTAWTAGADVVKVFPANRFGPPYIREVLAPLDGVRLMPTGGVDFETFAEYRAAGAVAFGVGSPLFAKERIAAADWAWVESQTRRFVEAWRRSGPGD